MGKETGPDRRNLARSALSIDVQFHAYDSAEKRPLTRKVAGRLVNLSVGGACLETAQTLIDGYHLMLHDDIDGGTPLLLDLPADGEGGPFTLKARVLWYNRIPGGTEFRFRVGLKFLEVSPEEKKRLEALLRLTAASSRA